MIYLKTFESFQNKIIAYHGTNNVFGEFDYKYVGIGNDEYGPGFYFTSDPTIAAKYGEVGKYELTIDKPILIKQKPVLSEVSFLLKNAPEYKDTLTDFAENTMSALKMAINSYMEYGDGKIDSYLSIWGDFYAKRGNSADFVKNLVKLKYDAYVFNFEEHTMYVVYDITKIKKI